MIIFPICRNANVQDAVAIENFRGLDESICYAPTFFNEIVHCQTPIADSKRSLAEK